MTKKVVVIGGGISGRLFQHVYGKHIPVFDAGLPPRDRPRMLTQEFGANYLWSPLAGIHCRSFPVITHIDGQPATQSSILRYKEKVLKQHDNQPWGDQFEAHQTGYEIDQRLDNDVQWNSAATCINTVRKVITITVSENKVNKVKYDTLISTIPMTRLLQLIQPTITHSAVFKYRPIYVRVERRPLDAPYPLSSLYVNYLSDPDVLPYRVTDRFGYRHYEGLTRMGKLPTKTILPGKIYFDSKIEKIEKCLNNLDIYCVGRFASWNPEMLVTHTYAYILTLGKIIYE